VRRVRVRRLLIPRRVDPVSLSDYEEERISSLLFPECEMRIWRDESGEPRPWLPIP